MATLAQVTTAIADTIRAVLEDVDQTIQVEPHIVLAPAATCIDVYPADPSDDQTLAGFGDTYGGELLYLRARLGSADSDSEQALLLALMDDEDPLSVSDALESDPTLNGTVQTMHLLSRSGIRQFQDPDGIVYVGCLWQLTIVKARS